MVSDMQEFAVTDRVTVRYIVRCILEQSGAIRADQIARKISLDIETIREELACLIRMGLVEVLRPLTADLRDPGETVEAEYYRWIRVTDNDYLWQAQLLAQAEAPPASPRREEALFSLMNF